MSFCALERLKTSLISAFEEGHSYSPGAGMGAYYTAYGCAEQLQNAQTVFVTKCLKHFYIFNVFGYQMVRLAFKFVDLMQLYA